MSRHTYTEVRTVGDRTLYRREDGRFVTVGWRGEYQIQDVMPGHRPAGGGWWVAQPTDSGIDYVTGGKAYSKSYATKFLRGEG